MARCRWSGRAQPTERRPILQGLENRMMLKRRIASVCGGQRVLSAGVRALALCAAMCAGSMAGAQGSASDRSAESLPPVIAFPDAGGSGIDRTPLFGVASSNPSSSLAPAGTLFEPGFPMAPIAGRLFGLPAEKRQVGAAASFRPFPISVKAGALLSPRTKFYAGADIEFP